MVVTKLVASVFLVGVSARNSLSRTPPMGWMSWEIFRCETDCAAHPDTCISEKLYQQQTTALQAGGYVAAGYTGIHMDDCWEAKNPKRDSNGRLYPDAERFPSGMKALGDFMHKHGATFGLYTAESPTTCGGYPASADNEPLDAKTFAEWGVDYMKVDGCGPAAYYKKGYAAMGAALEASGRDIVYSCSWPAYINGENETLQPFGEFIMDGCNLWRNYRDIQCSWASLVDIINHWGNYGYTLAPFAGPGHWHDMDMLLIGNTCITIPEERTQMAIWAISASPLIMGNDLRSVRNESKAILLNKHAIAVSQDPLGQMGIRLTDAATDEQVWARNLADGSVAVALFNRGGNKPIPPRPSPTCPDWTTVDNGYYEACGGSAGDVGSFGPNMSVENAKAACCANAKCVSFSYDRKTGSGFYKANAQCGMTKNSEYDGYVMTSQIPVAANATVPITVNFADINLYGDVSVFDIWASKDLGTHQTSFTAQVDNHDSAFLILSSKK